ncbi:CobW family GTP-binding protein [Trinickia dinghuensis]|uniref:GTP-binding protein n=1 Tax=Trinickia dinghuensis TaxID=2291023 RepID=A0A3D8K197_9BURK|nr:GTP-binding protein [Trinickia dinghuensis]RDU98842.1 GTP-binding protein [Trinickia dinghuensis]
MNSTARSGNTCPDARPPIPLVVLGGYLGAGKTTMINALLTHAEAHRITVLVNDFGSINIDATLIRERSDDVIGLENGCVCCSIGGKLVETLLEISARASRPDLLVIEASGVSDPVRIAQIGMLDRAFQLQGIVVAVDAEQIRITLDDAYVGDMARRQIVGATALVLTKSDLIAGQDLNDAYKRVRDIAHTRLVFESHQGTVPRELFFGGARPLPENETAFRLSHSLPSHLPENLRSFTYRSAARFDRKRLKTTLVSLSDRLLRAKGFVCLEDGTYAEIHVVGKRWHLSAHGKRDIADTTIVLIGMFDDDEMQSALDAIESSATLQSSSPSV